MQPTFYEFFAGGGMARAGLGPDWRCLFANDIDPMKGAAYVDNWGDAEFRPGDIFALKPSDLPGHADLAWASFPCQDLSLAGNGAGLEGDRSGVFWGFWSLMNGLRAQGRAPKVLVLENVGGAVTSKGGKDFESLCGALRSLGYVYGALMIDAVHFVPQSRPRVFFIALRSDLDRRQALAVAPASPWTTAALKRSHARLPPHLRQSWRWWRLPSPPPRTVGLSDLIDDEPKGVRWHDPEETARLLSMMSPGNLAKVTAAQRRGRQVVGTIYRRTRPNESGAKVQRAEVRFDDISGCLRTPSGGSSRQTVIVVEGGHVRTRLLSTREAARLMGLPDSYKLPERYNDAYHLMGDGLAVPVVNYLAKQALHNMCLSNAYLVAAE